MRQLYKYDLDVTPVQTITLPVGAEILSASVQTRGFQNIPVIWARVDEEAGEEDVNFHLVPTGSDLSSDLSYIDRIDVDGLHLHLFREPSN